MPGDFDAEQAVLQRQAELLEPVSREGILRPRICGLPGQVLSPRRTRGRAGELEQQKAAAQSLGEQLAEQQRAAQREEEELRAALSRSEATVNDLRTQLRGEDTLRQELAQLRGTLERQDARL